MLKWQIALGNLYRQSMVSQSECGSENGYKITLKITAEIVPGQAKIQRKVTVIGPGIGLN